MIPANDDHVRAAAWQHIGSRRLSDRRSCTELRRIPL